MRKVLLALPVLTGLSVALHAQAAGQQSTPPTTAGQSRTTTIGQKSDTAASQQDWSGVLMDASCSVIASATTNSSRSVTSYTGSSAQSAPQSAESTKDASPARSTTEAGVPARQESTTPESGERSRTATADPATSASFTTVREKYRDCMVKPTTTSFAIHSDGRLIVLDEPGNEVVRQQMTSEQFRSRITDAGGNSKWTSVTLNGSMKGERLNVTSVQK
jgi:hypothetical protein